MKKHKKVIKIINIMLVIILISIFNNGCNERTPYYHHPAVVETIIGNYSFEVNGSCYVYKDRIIYKLEDNIFKKICQISDLIEEKHFFHFEAYNNKIYITTSVDTNANMPCYLYVYDCNFNLIEKNETQHIDLFNIYGDWLYYIKFSPNGYYLLHKYNLNSKEIVFLCEVEGKEIVEVDGLHIYVPFSFNSRFYILEQENNITFYDGNRHTINFVYNNKIGYISEDGEHIFIEYDGMIYGKSTGHWSQFTKGAIVNDNKIRFASYCEIEKGEDYIGCELISEDCICRHDKSYIWEFDFVTKEFTLLKEINESSYVIGFDNDGYYYYMNSAIYKNDTKLYDYPTIEISGKYNRFAWFAKYINDSHVSLNYFHLYDGNVYYYYLDNSSQIKDYYE